MRGYRAQTSVECNNYHDSRTPGQERSGILPRLVSFSSGIGWYGFGFGLSPFLLCGLASLFGNHCSQGC
jgi:hypothetical protein